MLLFKHSWEQGWSSSGAWISWRVGEYTERKKARLGVMEDAPWNGTLNCPTCDTERYHLTALGPPAVVSLTGVVPRMPCSQGELKGCLSSKRCRGVRQSDIFMIKPVQNGRRRSLIFTVKLCHIPDEGQDPRNTDGEERVQHWN